MAKLKKLALALTAILATGTMAIATGCQFLGSNGDSSSDSSSSQTATYTVTFADEDGTVLETVTVEEGETPAFTGTAPTKESTVEKVFTFAGWDKTVAPATENVTYTATYSESARKYTVTWLNYDGSVLATEEVAYGVTPEYTGTTPTKAETDEFSYTYTGFGDVAVVTGEATYTAQFSESKKQYDVTLVYDNGMDNVTFSVDYGTTAEVLYTADYTPSKTGYTFAGWYVGEIKVEATDVVTTNMVITASWSINSYTVKFLNWDGSVLSEETLEYGSPIIYMDEPTKDATTDKTFEFAGWTPAFENGVTTVPVDGITFTAVFNETARKYAIKFVNYDDSLLATVDVAFGEVPTFDGVPTASGFSIFEQVFNGWDRELAPVDGEATYKATYKAGAATQLSSIAALDAGVWECMGANEDGTYYICGQGRQFGWNAGQFVEAQNGIGISNAVIQQAKAAGYNYLEVAVRATNWFSVSNKPVYNAWADTHQAYCDMVKDAGDYIVIDFSNITETEGYTLFATCSNVVHIKSAKFVNTPVTENVDYASILYGYGRNENGNGNSPYAPGEKYYDNNNGKGGMYWAQNDKAVLQQYLGINTSRTEGFSSDVAFFGTVETGTGATMYLKDYDSDIGVTTVEQAKASGMTKLIVTVWVSNTNASVYYWAEAREWESGIASGGAKATIDANGFATVEIDISNFDATSANYLTLPALFGNSGDWMAYMSIKFAK